MFREKWDVLEMQNLGRAVRRCVCDLNHIESKRARRLLELAQVRIDRTSQNFLLPPVHRKIAGNESAFRPRLHFNKDQRITVAKDQIDFPPTIARITPISRYEHKPMRALQPVRGVLFSARAGVISNLGSEYAL